MASVFVIPILIVIVAGLSGYLAYRYLLYDLYCRRLVSRSLAKYRIDKTPAQIIREYYAAKGESISPGEVRRMEKEYRQKEPDQFLAMYDATRESTREK